MNLFDALNNWLQLKIVSDSRPEDEAAKISYEHVADILLDVHEVKVTGVKKDEKKYTISYVNQGDEKIQEVPIEAAEVLLQFINENPERYDFK